MSAKIIRGVILTTAFLALFCAQVTAKNKAAEKERLKMSANKVSVMNEFMFFPKTNTQKKMSYQAFNAVGNKISSIELDNEEKVIKKTEFAYDEKNNEISFTERDGEGNMRLKCESKYDETTGALSGELFYNASGTLAYKRVPKFDKNGNICEQTLYDKNNKFLGKSVYKYDGAGNKIESTSYDASGNFNGRYAYGYDRNGNLTETLSYDKNNKFSGKKIFNYDHKGLLTESIGYNSAGTANSWRKYEYEFRKDAVAAAKPSPALPEKKPEAKNPPRQAKLTETKTEEPKTERHEENNLKNDKDLDGPPQPSDPATTAGAYQPVDYFNPDVNTSMTPAEIINFAVVAKPETVKGLAEHNSMDLNAQNERGQTALMLAVLGENEKMVEFLLSSGVDLKIKDMAGIDVLYYASVIKNAKIKKMIREHYEKK